MNARIGFVGTGAITSAIVTGLRSGYDIHLSPRNADLARDLARRFSNVSVASSNQDVLDRSDTVVLAIRPAIAAEVIAALQFRPDHRLISVMNGVAIDQIATMAAPATKIVRAVPLPSVAHRLGPTPIYPPDRFTAEMFNAIGIAIEVDTESAFTAFCAATGTIAAFFAFANAIASWLARHGIPEDEARDYTARMIRGLMVEQDFHSSAKEHATSGGINEQFLHHLAERGMFDSVSSGLDALLRRMN